MKGILSMLPALLLVISLPGSALASLDITQNGSTSVASAENPEFYCGLALPLDEGEGGEGDETDKSEEEPQDGSESEPDSETQTENQPDR